MIVAVAIALIACLFTGFVIGATSEQLKLPEEKTESADRVNSPVHYRLKNGMQAIDIMELTCSKEELEGFYFCNVQKYIFRHKHKNGVEDLKKARWYLDKLIELECDADK